MYCNFGKESRSKSVIFFHIEFFKVKMMFKECVQVSLYIIITVYSNKHVLFYECEYNLPCKVLIL